MDLTPEFKLRTSVSLEAKYVFAWELAKRKYGAEKIGAFSDFVSEAIISYAKQHHEDLVSEAKSMIEKNPEIILSHKFFNAKNPTGKKIKKSKVPPATSIDVPLEVVHTDPGATLKGISSLLKQGDVTAAVIAGVQDQKIKTSLAVGRAAHGKGK